MQAGRLARRRKMPLEGTTSRRRIGHEHSSTTEVFDVRNARIVTISPLLAVAATVDAQVRTTGQIVGTVRDPTGAVVPDAEIEIRDLATASPPTTRSARDGGFVFVAVQPGRYTLTAIAKGFQPIVIETITRRDGARHATRHPGRGCRRAGSREVSRARAR